MIVLCACQPTNKFAKDTQNINRYLSSTLGTQLRKDGTTYFFVSDQCCHSCFNSVVNARLTDAKSVLVLGLGNAHHIGQIATHKNVLIDTTGNISRLVYANSNIGIVKTKNGEVTEILYPEPINIMTVLSNL
jgi:hypothetical protein